MDKRNHFLLVSFRANPSDSSIIGRAKRFNRIFEVMYLLRIPKLVKTLYPSFLEWSKAPSLTQPTIYLTFDDGPHPKATPFVLDELKKYEAKATFFCLGKNVIEYPEIYAHVLNDGHTLGNHTHRHLNGWKTQTREYVEDVVQASQYIDSRLFRPPYGRIKRMQASQLRKKGYQIIMWSLISADFDQTISRERCLENVIFHLKPGDIVVFHDSEKAWERMSYVLPRVLQHCKKQKWCVGQL